MTTSYPSYVSKSGFNQFDNNRDQRYMDSSGCLISNPFPTIFSTATVASNSPAALTRKQQSSCRSRLLNNLYDTPRNYSRVMTSGYVSDTNDLQRSSISVRPIDEKTLSFQRAVNTTERQSIYPSSATIYSTKSITTNNDQSYHSDSESYTSGPRYTKITRQAKPNRRLSNIVLPIRSITSKAYDQYETSESPQIQQQPFDIYRYQQEQRERERQKQLQRQLYQHQQPAATQFRSPPQFSFPSQDQRRKSDSKRTILVSSLCLFFS